MSRDPPSRVRDLRARLATFEAENESLRERAKQLERERQRLATIFDVAASGIVETSLDGQLLSANRAFQEMLGYGPEELLRKTSMELTHPDDTSPSRANVRALRRGEVSSFSMDKRYQRKDGSFVEAQVRVSVTRDAEGKPERHITVIRDLTEQRRAERVLRRLKPAVEQSHDGIVMTDRAGRIQYANAAFERGSGYTLEEVRGQTPRVLKSGVQDDEFYRELWATITGGETWQGRFVNRRKDGSLYTEESSITPVLGEDGEIEGYVAIKRDLTERLELEERLRQSQKLEAIGRLAGGIAHDFNNLLLPVLVDSEILLEELGAEDTRRELVQEILEAAERAKELTRRLLAFSRRQVLEMRGLDLRELVTGFGRVLERILREDVRLRFETGLERAPTTADLGQLEQVLMNLALNAQDAMPMGGELVVRVLPHADAPQNMEGPGWVAFEVQDTGAGMGPDTLRRATEPFFTTKARAKGTGLGLSTSHGIVRQHGGDLRITSALGEGTCVRVTLPQLDAEPPRASTAPPPGSAHAASLRGKRVWLVEDDDAVARSTARLLRNAGAVVTLFGAAPELLDQLRGLKPADVLITDVILPGMDGRALHELLEQRLRSRLPVVFVSGYPDEILSPHGVLEADLHFVVKPFSGERLIREVEVVLSEAQALEGDGAG